MKHILIADDHAVVRKGMMQILQDAGLAASITEAGNGQQALQAARQKTFDAILLDISMPGKSGIEVLKQLKGENIHTPVLVLSMYSEEQYAVRLIRAGAAGYLTKESAPDLLAEAVQTVMLGKRYISPAVAELLAESLSQRSSAAPEQETPHRQLTDREFAVFLKLAAGMGPTEIAQGMNLSVKTIASYRARILQKMGLRTNAELTLYANRNALL
ncbi:MAG TPA: response regulator transcription factor, partial [Motiliproteus sp.]